MLATPCPTDLVAAGRCRAHFWTTLGAPAGERLAAVSPDLIERPRREDELDLTDETHAKLTAM